MNICICDDEKRERKIIRRICEEYFGERTLLYEIWEAESATEVLERKEKIDLLILDIEMPEMDGVTLKNRLQSREEELNVIFVTSHEELMPEAFGKHVIGFVAKEWLKIKLPRYLNLAVSLVGKSILIARNYNSRDVIKIHSEREYCNLYMKDGSTNLLRGSLKEMEEVLQEVDFVRISRSWLVNLRYVQEFHKREIVIEGEVHSIGRGYTKAVETAYDNFCERNAKYC